MCLDFSGNVISPEYGYYWTERGCIKGDFCQNKTPANAGVCIISVYLPDYISLYGLGPTPSMVSRKSSKIFGILS